MKPSRRGHLPLEADVRGGVVGDLEGARGRDLPLHDGPDVQPRRVEVLVQAHLQAAGPARQRRDRGGTHPSNAIAVAVLQRLSRVPGPLSYGLVSFVSEASDQTQGLRRSLERTPVRARKALRW